MTVMNGVTKKIFTIGEIAKLQQMLSRHNSVFTSDKTTQQIISAKYTCSSFSCTTLYVVCVCCHCVLCVQKYSSGLTQYKFDTFGGFYITDVEREIKRGQLLVSE